MPRKDPFRTLDDPAPRAPLLNCGDVPAGYSMSEQMPDDAADFGPLAMGANRIMTAQGKADSGYWVIPSGRPGWLRRALVRLVLGWKWRKL